MSDTTTPAGSIDEAEALDEVLKRGTGRTMAFALKTIATAMEHPDRWVYAADADTEAAHLQQIIGELSDRLDLLLMIVRPTKESPGVLVRSMIIEMKLATMNTRGATRQVTKLIRAMNVKLQELHELALPYVIKNAIKIGEDDFDRRAREFFKSPEWAEGETKATERKYVPIAKLLRGKLRRRSSVRAIHRGSIQDILKRAMAIPEFAVLMRETGCEFELTGKTTISPES